MTTPAGGQDPHGPAAGGSTVAEVTGLLDRYYPQQWAESWDRVGLVLGDPAAPVRRVLLAVDCVPETAEAAVETGADLLVVHHPLLLRGVSSVAPTTYKGRIVHRLIRAGVALFVAHTNADVAAPGVSDALAERVGLTELAPLVPADGAAAGDGRGHGRVGELPEPTPLAQFVATVGARLPATAWGVRAAGDPDRLIRRVAVCGGAGDAFLAAAVRAGVDAYVTADLRHHPASEHVAAGGPALVDAAHWATERPWLDAVAATLRADAGVTAVVSDLVTDPWTLHTAPAHAGRSGGTALEEPRS